LRNRREDIPLLAETFLEEMQREKNREIEGFTDEVLDLFDTYPWPGNVRELRNVVERAVLFCRGTRITVNEIPATLRGASAKRPVVPVRGEVIPLQQASERAEIEAIRAALAASQGRRSEAAEMLGISRKTLWEKVKHYGISVDS
jgi:DNA-binding NtrC family response regulator